MAKMMTLGVQPVPHPLLTQKRKDIFLDSLFLSHDHKDANILQMISLVPQLHYLVVILAKGPLNPKRRKDTKEKTVSFLKTPRCA